MISLSGCSSVSLVTCSDRCRIADLTSLRSTISREGISEDEVERQMAEAYAPRRIIESTNDGRLFSRSSVTFLPGCTISPWRMIS